MVTARTSTPAPPESGTAVAKVPPHDLDAEAAVISAVLLDASALTKIGDFLQPEHFYSGAHRAIFESVCELHRDGGTVDVITVGGHLKDRQRLALVGGAGYIASILDTTPAPANVRAHATIVFERWRVRTAMLLCERASIFGHNVVDPQSYLDSVIAGLAKLARTRPGEKPESNFDVLRRIVRMAWDTAHGNTPASSAGPALRTGIKAYDDHLGGLYAGQKTTIVARPRVGKTALALQIAMNVARQGVAVAFWSTEMSREEIADRQLANLASVNSKRLVQARQKDILSSDEWNRVMLVVDDAQAISYKLHVYDDAGPTVDDICSQTQVLAEQSLAIDGVPLGLVVVDYVQKLTPSPTVAHRKKYEQIAYATERLKRLARELKVPVIELAQEKNSEKGKSGKRERPELGDAAESFQIERSADNVVYLYRPLDRDGKHLKLAIVKQRQGEEAEEDIVLEREFSRFVAADPYGPRSAVSRQYVDPMPEPPPGRFDDDDNALTEGL